jgi:hypothetical protein
MGSDKGEEIMLVYVDPESRTVSLIEGKTVKVFPVSYIALISKEIEGKDVVYVSETLNTTGDEVINLLNEMAESDMAESISSGTLYLRYTSRSKCLVNYNGKSIYFEGKYDLKPLNMLPQEILEKCPTIVNGIRDGSFELVNEQTRIFIQQEQEEEIAAKEAKMEREELLRNQEGSYDNPIQINLGGGGGKSKR